MPPRPKGRKLTPKEEATIAETVRAVSEGESFSVSKAVEKIHDVKKSSSYAIANKKLQNPDFRSALLVALENRKIIGANSKVEARLAEGLDAEGVAGQPELRVRLDYIKEINKIAGVYAAEKKEVKSLRLNLDMTKEELKERIETLQDEMDDI